MAAAAMTSLFFFIFLFPCLSQPGNDSYYYDKCVPFSCGNNLTLAFPFSPLESLDSGVFKCGIPGYNITCERSPFLASLIITNKPYQVKSLFASERLIIVSDTRLIESLSSGDCNTVQNFTPSISKIANLSFPNPVWKMMVYLHFFKCPKRFRISDDYVQRVLNYTNCDLFVARNYTEVDFDNTEIPSVPMGCIHVMAPVLRSTVVSTKANTSGSDTSSKSLNVAALEIVLAEGFPLQWPEIADCTTCNKSNGRCGFDADLSQVKCFFKDLTRSKSLTKRRIFMGVTTAGSFIVLAMAVTIIFRFKHISSLIFIKDYFKSKRKQKNDQNVEEFIQRYTSMLVAKYSYSEIQKMTNGFKEKLGEGGYGNVYKGKLSDGRLVATKILEKSLDDGQDFINEVATIGTIHHFNVIRLLGFCWEGHRRALVYEFMSNGSLGDLIAEEDVTHFLGWSKLLEIAVAIAHGIEYLHQGCDTRILHLDIKPHNVLLDAEYRPKISDFGLAKSYSRKHSVVSLTGAKGTVGYVAPEVFLRNFGGVSHKSDVYSYGMLLLELIGGRKNVASKPESSSVKYFPDWIYSQLDADNDMEIVDSIVEEDQNIARKMVKVGLWCIQMKPVDRPSMTGVIEMLTGSEEELQMPPKPFLFSPPRPQSGHEVSTTEGDSNYHSCLSS